MFVAINVFDLCMIVFLVFLEGILSIDNALILAVTVRHLPVSQRQKALSYGIWSAFLFRFLALFFLQQLMKIVWIKLLGAGYLLWLGMGHFILPSTEKKETNPSTAGFWKTIFLVELLDLAFSLDSIFATVGISNNLVIVFIGGSLGIVMMRFCAGIFVKLIETFKQLESVAYGLVIIIGVKLGIQGFLGLL